MLNSMKQMLDSEKTKMYGIVNSQHGVALVLAIVMLVLMSILGVFALSTSTTEIGIAGNYRNSQEAFYTADAAIERAQTDSAIYSTIVPGSVESWTNTSTWTIGNGTVSANNVSVQYLTNGALPLGTGSDPEIFQAYYFVATANATGPNNSIYNVESQVARVVPK